jgi:hypothetical protein
MIETERGGEEYTLRKRSVQMIEIERGGEEYTWRKRSVQMIEIERAGEEGFLNNITSNNLNVFNE